MTRLHGKRPSPAMVVSIVALVVAMAGTGYAQFTLPDKSVGNRQLKNGQATVDGNDGGGTDAAQVSLGTTTGCPTGTQAMVYTFNNAGANNDGFFVVFYK